MSFKPTSNQPDLETVGRFLSALGELYERTAPTLKHLGAVALEKSRTTEPRRDQDVSANEGSVSAEEAP